MKHVLELQEILDRKVCVKEKEEISDTTGTVISGNSIWQCL